MPDHFPALIISGGQTGADRAGLDFAIAHGLPHGGFCPRGRRSENGPIPAAYQLTETASSDYPERTRRNIESADATVIFAVTDSPDTFHRQRGGSALTAREALRLRRPFVVLPHFPDVSADADELRRFLQDHRPHSLNIAGSRESRQPGIAAHVIAVLSAVVSPSPATLPAAV